MTDMHKGAIMRFIHCSEFIIYRHDCVLCEGKAIWRLSEVAREYSG